MGSKHEQNGCRKSRDTLPLTVVLQKDLNLVLIN